MNTVPTMHSNAFHEVPSISHIFQHVSTVSKKLPNRTQLQKLDAPKDDDIVQ